jgi:hypothetical protein
MSTLPIRPDLLAAVEAELKRPPGDASFSRFDVRELVKEIYRLRFEAITRHEEGPHDGR